MVGHHSETFDHHRGRMPLLRPTGRLRTGIFLVINLAGFAAVNAFWQYLATGRWAEFSLTGYRRAMVTPLGEMFLHPLNILTHPWMVLVMGLLLGLVILVPIIVAVLYRLLWAGLFVVMVAAVGHAPVLALALAVGCMLAARTPLRSDMPFLAVVVGLLPIALYLYVFAFKSVDAPAARPLQKWVFYAPFVLAAVSAVIGGAAVLLLTRVTGFRPGVVWPVLAVLLAGPMSVFYLKVGPEDLDYGVLTDGLAPADAVFAPEVLDDWRRRHGVAARSDEEAYDAVCRDMQRRRDRLVERCKGFLKRHPDGRHAPAVMWLQAQCLSLRVDRAALEVGLLKYTASYCLPASALSWLRLKELAPSADQAALARWRLGELAIRDGALQEGIAQLQAAAGRLRELVPKLSAPVEEASVFMPPRRLPNRGHYEEALSEVERLMGLVQQNDALAPGERGAKARRLLIEFLHAPPDDRKALEVLSLAARRTALEDNIALALARATPDIDQKAGALLDVATRRDPNGLTDGAVAATYDLGLLAMRPAELGRLRTATRERVLARTPEQYFLAVVAAGQQPWKRLAEERLARLRQAVGGRGQS